MASYSQTSYNLSSWQQDAAQVRESCDSRPLTSVYCPIKTSTTSQNHVSILEESVKSKLTITSDFQSSMDCEEAETKLKATLATYTDKIKYLEKQKEILEGRLSMLPSEETPHNDLERVYLNYISRLLGEVNQVTQKNHQTQRQLLDMMDSVNDMKDKFEDELCRRTDVEYSYVDLKKEADCRNLERTGLECKKQEMKDMIDLMTSVYEEELKGVMEESEDISVLVNIGNNCPINLEHVVKDVKERYESIAARSREEAQALFKSKLSDGVLTAGRYEAELESSRREITHLNSKIQRIRSEVLSNQNKCLHLEQEVSLTNRNSEMALSDAKAKVTEVQDALLKAKQDLAQHIFEYQELMNVKLALDMEIATYKRLLEGEESRLQSPPPAVNVQYGCDVFGTDYPSPNRVQKRRSFRNLQN